MQIASASFEEDFFEHALHIRFEFVSLKKLKFQFQSQLKFIFFINNLQSEVFFYFESFLFWLVLSIFYFISFFTL